MGGGASSAVHENQPVPSAVDVSISERHSKYEDKATAGAFDDWAKPSRIMSQEEFPFENEASRRILGDSFASTVSANVDVDDLNCDLKGSGRQLGPGSERKIGKSSSSSDKIVCKDQNLAGSRTRNSNKFGANSLYDTEGNVDPGASDISDRSNVSKEDPKSHGSLGFSDDERNDTDASPGNNKGSVFKKKGRVQRDDGSISMKIAPVLDGSHDHDSNSMLTTYSIKGSDQAIVDESGNISSSRRKSLSQKSGQMTLKLPGGAVYRGAVVSNMRHGHGVYTFPNGVVFEGEYARDRRHGHGVTSYPSGTVVTAEYKEGEVIGPYTVSYVNGDEYIGAMKNHMRHGKGVFHYANGDVCDGEYMDDMRHGHCTMTRKSGETFKGEYRKDVINGLGKFCFASGDSYQGDFSNGVGGGTGIYTYANGDRYQGQFKDNMMHGKGTFTSEEGTYVGNYERNRRSGHGEKRDKNGDSYVGEWTRNVMSGFGTQKLASGEIYAGEFKNNLRHGEGRCIYPDESYYEGSWVHGNRQNGVVRDKTGILMETIGGGPTVDKSHNDSHLSTSNAASGVVTPHRDSNAPVYVPLHVPSDTKVLKCLTEYAVEDEADDIRTRTESIEHIDMAGAGAGIAAGTGSVAGVTVPPLPNSSTKSNSSTPNSSGKSKLQVSLEDMSVAELRAYQLALNEKLSEQIRRKEIEEKRASEKGLTQGTSHRRPSKLADGGAAYDDGEGNLSHKSNASGKSDGGTTVCSPTSRRRASSSSGWNQNLDQDGNQVNVHDHDSNNIVTTYSIKGSEQAIVDENGNISVNRRKTLSQKSGSNIVLKMAGGATYTGDVVNNMRHGHGIYTFPNGVVFEGEYARDRRHGHGVTSYPSGIVVEAVYVKGEVPGDHTVSYTNGDKYIGKMNSKNQRHGHGVFYYANGDVCDGEYVNDMRHGHCTMTRKSGDIFVGRYENDIINGLGKFCFASGDSYEGNFKNSVGCGTGVYTYANGDRYIGDFVDNKMHGKGTFTSEDGTYEGDYNQNRRYGHGKMTHKNGDVYEGEWVRNQRYGYGVSTLKTGEVYAGEYKNNVRNGPGTCTYVNGNVFDGTWLLGNRHIGKLKDKDGNILETFEAPNLMRN